MVIVSTECVVEGAVDLVEVQIRGGRSGRQAALVAAVLVDVFDDAIQFLGRHQPRPPGGVTSIAANIDNANSIVGIKHGHSIRRTHLDPAFQIPGSGKGKGMQHERRKRKVVNPVCMCGNLLLKTVMGMYFHKSLKASAAGGS